jgi:transposase
MLIHLMLFGGSDSRLVQHRWTGFVSVEIVAKALSGRAFLPDPIRLTFCNVEKGEQGWVIEAETSNAAACPDCGISSRARHSSYVRHLRDLPLQGLAVKIRLRVGRWRCRNSNCERKIFTERVSTVAAPHRQRTERLESVVQLVSRSLGGRPAERLMRRLGMAVSNDTILRHLKRRAQSTNDKKLRVVGVDDWAWKKGQHYGTILVDLERQRVADLLPERSAQQVERWFEQHPSIEIVSRDRFGLYARAAHRGAPQARQVADRFHLLVNLQEAVEHELSRQRRLLFYVDPARSELTTETAFSNPRGAQPNIERAAQYRDVMTERRAIQQALFETVHRLRQAGMNVSRIVRETGISRKRVDKWVRLAELPERNKMEPKVDSPAFFRDYLARRWSAGCHRVKTLLAELRTRGYTGCFSGLARFVSGWRTGEQGTVPMSEQQTPVNEIHPLSAGCHHVSSCVAAALLLKPRPLLTAAQIHKVNGLKKSCPAFALMRSLAMQFRGILRSGSVKGLMGWMDKAKHCGIYSLKRFAKTLRRDWNAVQNALKEPFSNGPVEGHINRLKTLKREMYGRAGFELLRARLLPSAVP